MIICFTINECHTLLYLSSCYSALVHYFLLLFLNNLFILYSLNLLVCSAFQQHLLLLTLTFSYLLVLKKSFFCLFIVVKILFKKTPSVKHAEVCILGKEIQS